MHKFDVVFLSLVCGIAAVFLLAIPARKKWSRKTQIIFAISCPIFSILFIAIFQAVFKQDPVTYVTQKIEEKIICQAYDFEHCTEMRERAVKSNSDREKLVQPLPASSTNKTGIGAAKQKSQLPQVEADTINCVNISDSVIKVRLVPALANFQQNALTQLERNLNCEKFSFSSGRSGRFPDEDLNALAYSGAIDYKSISLLVSKIKDMGVNIRYACNNVSELYDDYVLLAHYNYAGDRPLSAGELNILIKPDSKSQFDSILSTHVCHGPWPLEGPAARK